VSRKIMKKQTGVWILILASLAFVSAARAQSAAQPQQVQGQAGTSSGADNQNTQAYIELLRSNVRQQKSEMMGAVMQLSAADAAKVWPIYREYDAELNKLNDLRVANIEEYARTYGQMTDEKADELIQNGLTFRKQRSELLAKYYDRVKQELGAITAAHFIQVEDQLLLIIDLQIDSSLPIVGEAS
jgi:flagellar biosynthesis chaperone FliJ